ncbi:AMP-binding protein [Phytohabitans sp. ZYX-F-186]|uniref:AMP-binding protein n=1 Tax=Phytohabitans maris TaxID=3071409 RepID=A0ABU0Z9U4_9ACTN|nr:AMP-binding protein [Phytohabitans sp. ZYX-F-186]MDQ7903808.1 AMP-binding protein [Phytohabitans sp. ZYX-F-186]
MAREYTGTVPNFPRDEWSLATVLRAHAAARPHATVLACPDEEAQWTYAEALAEAEAIAGAWYAAGAEAGDRVLIMAANSSQFVRSWFGTAVGGLVEVPINTAYEGEFLRHQTQTVRPRWAVVDDVHAERFVAIAEHARGIEHFWVVDTGQADKAVELLRTNGWRADRWEALLDGARLALPDPSPTSLASIFFTSGTTGPSKGVAMPHAQMYFFGQEVVWLTRLTADDTYLTTTPLFHGNAQFMAAYPAIVAGARVVVRRKFSASRWIDHVRDDAVTVTNFVGVMMDFVWKQKPRWDDADNRLRCVYAAPTASSILRPFMERFGVESFVDAFGLTETSAPILSPYGEIRPPGAAGLLASEWFEARLVDPETDREVPVGEVGELVVRYKHPWTCSLGYYNMPEKTVEAWRNLWFHTGDALRRDEEGWYYFVDRYKDALRRRGENISSYEVEQAILQHPAVRECAVIGVPAGVEAGEDEVLAVVVTDAPVTAGELWEFCAGKIPAFATPRFVRFADALPKTPSEKVRKAALRDEGITPDTADRTVWAAG